jgi:hypothetical protein
VKPEHDSSLEAAALRRAAGTTPPRTLTPYEWEQWYAEHGVPEQHRATPKRAPRWWQRLWRLIYTT